MKNFKQSILPIGINPFEPMYYQTHKKERGATLLMQWGMKDVALNLSLLFLHLWFQIKKKKKILTQWAVSPFRELLVPVWSKWENSLWMSIHCSNMMNLEFEYSPALGWHCMLISVFTFQSCSYASEQGQILPENCPHDCCIRYRRRAFYWPIYPSDELWTVAVH